MANGEGNGNASVNYTVKELLEMAQERADERHELTLRAIAEVDAKVTALGNRTEVLEKDRHTRAVFSAVSGKAIAVGVSFCILLVNIPAMLLAAGKL